MRFTPKLKDPRLVERWERLLPYARSAPQRPEFVLYHNALNSDEVLVLRQRRAPSFVYFMKADAGEISDMLDSGGTAVMKEYKISTYYPFALAYTTTASDEPRLGFWRREAALLHRMHMFLGTDLLAPTVEEMDELLGYLEGAERHVIKARNP